MKTVNPQLTRMAQKEDPNFNTHAASVLTTPKNDILRISHEQELPLPGALTHQSYEISPPTIRHFGIND